jgi:hypothetical protein
MWDDVDVVLIDGEGVLVVVHTVVVQIVSISKPSDPIPDLTLSCTGVFVAFLVYSPEEFYCRLFLK